MDENQGKEQTRAIADEMMRSVGISGKSKAESMKPSAQLPTTDRTTYRKTNAGQDKSYGQRGLKSQGRRTQVVSKPDTGAPSISVSALRQQYPLLRESVAVDLDFDFIARRMHIAMLDALEAHALILCGGEEAIALRDRSAPIMARAAAKVVDAIVAEDWMRKTG